MTAHKSGNLFISNTDTNFIHMKSTCDITVMSVGQEQYVLKVSRGRQKYKSKHL